MRPVRRLLLGFVIISLVLAHGPAKADITPIMPWWGEWGLRSLPTGGAAAPKSPHDTIRMESEEVTIVLRKDRYTVDAVFHMLNTGETTTEWVGFPKRGEGTFPSFDAVSEFIRFDSWVDGKKMEFAEQREVNFIRHFGRWLSAIPLPLSKRSSWIEDSRWMMGHVRFLGHAKTMINVRYDARYASDPHSEHGRYIYGTGRNWKDSIGNACFTIDCTGKRGVDRAAVDFSKADAQKYTINRKLISQNVVKYEIRDFEPDPDGTLYIRLDRSLTERDDETVLIHAARQGRVDIVKSILDNRVDPNGRKKTGDTPLIAASQGNYTAMITLLLKRGADINAKGKGDETPLIAAARAGHLSTVNLLLDRGADINAKDSYDRTAVSWAAERAEMNLVKLLRGRGATVTPDVAARLGDFTTAERLIRQGADVNKKDYSGRTALMYAAERGHAAVVRLLLDNGADVNAEDRLFRNALSYVARGDKDIQLALVSLPLERGADINAVSASGSNAMFVSAVEAGRVDIVKALLNRQVDVNAKDGMGRTALEVARKKGHKEIEHLLLARGAKKERGK